MNSSSVSSLSLCNCLWVWANRYDRHSVSDGPSCFELLRSFFATRSVVYVCDDPLDQPLPQTYVWDREDGWLLVCLLPV